MVSTRNAKALCTLVVLLLINVRRGQGIWCSSCVTYWLNTACITRPPPAVICPKDKNSCIVVAKYRLSGGLFSFTRSCSLLALPEACQSGFDKEKNETLEVCYTTCSTDDGCNAFITLDHLLDLMHEHAWRPPVTPAIPEEY